MKRSFTCLITVITIDFIAHDFLVPDTSSQVKCSVECERGLMQRGSLVFIGPSLVLSVYLARVFHFESITDVFS